MSNNPETCKEIRKKDTQNRKNRCYSRDFITDLHISEQIFVILQA